MNPSPQDFSDELISAYLDGELSPEEKARVEDMLIDSPEHRGLFEELKSLRTTLHSLPRYQLSGDFARRVIQKAEREMLVGAKEEQAAPSAEEAAAPPVLPTPAPPQTDEPHGGSWRSVVWAVAALAAALVVALALPSQFRPSSENIATDAGTENAQKQSIARHDDSAAEEETTEEFAPPASPSGTGMAGIRGATPPFTPAEAATLDGEPLSESVATDPEGGEAAMAEMDEGAPAAMSGAGNYAGDFSNDSFPTPFSETDVVDEHQLFSSEEALAQSDELPLAGFGESEGFADGIAPGSPGMGGYDSAGATGAAAATELLVELRIDAGQFDRMLEEYHIAYVAQPQSLDWQSTGSSDMARRAMQSRTPDQFSAESHTPQVAEAEAAAGPQRAAPSAAQSAQLADAAPATSGSDTLRPQSVEAADAAGQAEEATDADQWVLVEAPADVIYQLLAQLDGDSHNIVVLELSPEVMREQALAQSDSNFQQQERQELEYAQRDLAVQGALPQPESTPSADDADLDDDSAFSDDLLEEGADPGDGTGESDSSGLGGAVTDDNTPSVPPTQAQSTAETRGPAGGRAYRVLPRGDQAGRQGAHGTEDLAESLPAAEADEPDRDRRELETAEGGYPADPTTQPLDALTESPAEPPMVRVLFRVQAP